MWIYEESTQRKTWVKTAGSSMSLHNINKVTLTNSRWVNPNNGDDPYVNQSLIFSGDLGFEHEVITYDPNGIVVENADDYTVDYVTDSEGRKSIVIKLKAPKDPTP